MISPRRRAKLGLVAAALVFALAMSIVVAGSLEKPNEGVGLPGS